MSTSDPQEIRADIERTRGELSRDVDALGDRVNPRHVAQRRMDQARSGLAHVRDRLRGTAHDTLDTAQGNPLAAGLVAVGLVAVGLGLLIAGIRSRTAGKD